MSLSETLPERQAPCSHPRCKNCRKVTIDSDLLVVDFACRCELEGDSSDDLPLAVAQDLLRMEAS